MPPKRTARKPPRLKRKRSSVKGGIAKRKRTPRAIIRSSPSSAPNVHVFKRSYDHPFTIGVADHDNGVFLNTDSKWMEVRLHTKFNKLPNYTEFKSLFSEYMITSITHRLVPYYKDNVQIANATGSAAAYTAAIPNYEIFSVPVNSSAREAEFNTKTADEIDTYLNQAQRKAIRLMPSRTQFYRTTKPRVVGYKGPLSKDGSTALMAMERPTYLNTDPSPLVTGGVDQTDVTHYGITLLIRRVDGAAFPTPGANFVQNMGFRMETEVFFKCRKVQ